MLKKIFNFFNLRDFINSQEGLIALTLLPVTPIFFGFFAFIASFSRFTGAGMYAVIALGFFLGLTVQIYVFRKGVLQSEKVRIERK